MDMVNSWQRSSKKKLKTKKENNNNLLSVLKPKFIKIKWDSSKELQNCPDYFNKKLMENSP